MPAKYLMKVVVGMIQGREDAMMDYCVSTAMLGDECPSSPEQDLGLFTGCTIFIAVIQDSIAERDWKIFGH